MHSDFESRGFPDRFAAGRTLAQALSAYSDAQGLLVLGLPRGGVPVAHEVAEALDAELDVLVVRKLGVPWQPELAMGAVASGDVTVLNEQLIAQLGITLDDLKVVMQRAKEEVKRRERLYRGDRPGPAVAGRAVILVDDGIATGSTMKAGVQALKKAGAAKVIVAVPVAPAGASDEFAGLADDFVAVMEPDDLMAVGAWYLDFGQTSDDEVRELLASRGRRPGPGDDRR